MPVRELTEAETARLLTYDEVAALPDGTRIMVKWGGGNGPHEYTLLHHEGRLYAMVGGERHPTCSDWLEPIGLVRYHDRVFLPET